MTITKTPIGVNADGTLRFNYDYDGHPDGGQLITGPVNGTITLSDGTVYNITPEIIEVAPGHAGPICHHIGKIHEQTGLFGPDFKHACSDFCGMEADIPPASPKELS